MHDDAQPVDAPDSLHELRALAVPSSLRSPVAGQPARQAARVESAVNPLLSIAPIALLAALVAVPIYYLIYRYAPDPKKEVSVVRFVLVALAVGAVAYVIGTIAGIAAACSPANAGNLCGLVGVLGVGPLLSAAAILMYAHFWARHARQAP